MKMLRWLGFLVLVWGLAVGLDGAYEQALLHVSWSQLPTKTASDGQTQFTLVHSKELGGLL